MTENNHNMILEVVQQMTTETYHLYPTEDPLMGNLCSGAHNLAGRNFNDPLYPNLSPFFSFYEYYWPIYFFSLNSASAV